MIKDISKNQINSVAAGSVCIIEASYRSAYSDYFGSKSSCIMWCNSERAKFYIFSEAELEPDQIRDFYAANQNSRRSCLELLS